MTFGEMHILCDVLLDDSSYEWFNAEEKDLILNMAQSEYLKNRYSEFETSEKRREDLRLLTNYTTFGAGSTIDLSTLTGFFTVASLEGTFNYVPCEDASPIVITVPIEPCQLDDYRTRIRNSLIKPTDRKPIYIQYTDTIEIISDTVPTAKKMFYLVLPTRIDGENTPSGTPDFPEHCHEEIVNIAVRKFIEIREQSNRYQTQSNEINNQE